MACSLKKSMRPQVLLVHPRYGEETERRIFQPGIEFPISLAYLSAFLDASGIDTSILDLRLHAYPEAALRECIREAKPVAAGITASTAGMERASLAAKHIKGIDPGIVTILGGWHASAVPGEILEKYPEFDYVVHGEGEVALKNLVTAVLGGAGPESCKGIAFRSDGRIQINPREEFIADLDSLPFPARHKVPITRYRPKPGTRNYLSLPSTGILVGRGCPYGCLFCYKGVWGKNVRFRSPENVLQEIETCIHRFGIRDFRFYDDTITYPRWDLKRFCEGLIDRRLGISWNCWSRVNDVDREKLRLMKEAGCYHIKFGIEFGTEKALKLAGKGATLDQARRAIALCKEVGIECKGSFIFGIPGETIEDCRETVEFALRIAPHFATFYPFDPIPGSPFYQRIAEGKIDPKADVLPREVTGRLAEEAYRAFYMRPRFVMQRLNALLAHPVRESSMIFSGAAMLALFRLRKLKAPREKAECYVPGHHA